uniref:Ubiquitin-like domain-containing protein n=1 Tax=Hanusia phi TaxID=3032 RepID=A0A7S0F1F3_9CRYP
MRHLDYTPVQVCDDSIKIKIKTLDDTNSWEVEGEGSWTVKQLKDHLKENKGLVNKRIRLILLGKMLEDSHTLNSYGVKDGDFLHAAISDELPQAEVGVNVGRERNSDEDELRGFDRLLQAGFNRTEIEILRIQFHSRRGHFGRPLSEAEAVELEEEWLEQNSDGSLMPYGNNREEFGGSRRMDRVMEEVAEGTQADMMLGLVMGFIFGIIMLFWIWERGIPRRQKLGILCGIGCNLTMGMIRLQARTHGGRADSSHSHS